MHPSSKTFNLHKNEALRVETVQTEFMNNDILYFIKQICVLHKNGEITTLF